jgi:hypothetical protein
MLPMALLKAVSYSRRRTTFKKLINTAATGPTLTGDTTTSKGVKEKGKSKEDNGKEPEIKAGNASSSKRQ